MLKQVPRISFVFFTNGTLDYVLFFLLIILSNSHPWESGLLMVSPAGLAIFFLIIPSIATGFCNGFLLNLIPVQFIQKTKLVIILSVICSLITAFFWCGFFSLAENANYIFSLLFLAMLSVFSISNILTLLLTKRFFLNNNLINDEQETTSSST